jgi:hypothetical protein
MTQPSDWIVLNIGGKKFETTITTLKNIPYFASLDHFHKETFKGTKDSPFHVDADPTIFKHVLRYARNPSYVIPKQFLPMISFWGIIYEKTNERLWWKVDDYLNIFADEVDTYIIPFQLSNDTEIFLPSAYLSFDDAILFLETDNNFSTDQIFITAHTDSSEEFSITKNLTHFELENNIEYHNRYIQCDLSSFLLPMMRFISKIKFLTPIKTITYQCTLKLKFSWKDPTQPNWKRHLKGFSTTKPKLDEHNEWKLDCTTLGTNGQKTIKEIRWKSNVPLQSITIRNLEKTTETPLKFYPILFRIETKRKLPKNQGFIRLTMPLSKFSYSISFEPIDADVNFFFTFINPEHAITNKNYH